MSYYTRNHGAVPPAAQREAFRKAEQQHRPPAPNAQRLDAMSTTLGPDRAPVTDFRERQLAKAEAAEAHARAIRKADAERDAALAKSYTLRG